MVIRPHTLRLMNQYLLSILAFIGGVFLAVQGGFNARLGVLLENPLLASVSTFLSSFLLAATFIWAGDFNLPDREQVASVPIYLWFTGGFCSVIGIFLYFYTIPKLGISTMISLGLCGQLLFSVIAGHFGWLNLPTEPISLKRSLGVICMIIGIILIHAE